MNIRDYHQAVQKFLDAKYALDKIELAQKKKRNQIQKQLDKLNAEILPFQTEDSKAAVEMAWMRLRLIGPWKIERNEHWSSATIYVANQDTVWYNRRAWLRMVCMYNRIPKWQWQVDMDLFNDGKDLKRVFQCFGPSEDNEMAIDMDFTKHLASVSRQLEESGYIIVSESIEI